MENKTALLVMDVQNATMTLLPDPGAFIKAITQAIETARTKMIPVIYIVVGFRKGFPDQTCL